jgi:hypothetical protein
VCSILLSVCGTSLLSVVYDQIFEPRCGCY